MFSGEGFTSFKNLGAEKGCDGGQWWKHHHAVLSCRVSSGPLALAFRSPRGVVFLASHDSEKRASCPHLPRQVPTKQDLGRHIKSRPDTQSCPLSPRALEVKELDFLWYPGSSSQFPSPNAPNSSRSNGP